MKSSLVADPASSAVANRKRLESLLAGRPKSCDLGYGRVSDQRDNPMNSKMKFLAPMIAAVAMVVLAQTACDSGSSVSVPKSDFTATGLRKGYIAPDIEGTDLDGKPMKLSDFRGKAVVLEFWSST